MSLRSKVVGMLLGVFILYVFAAWLVLTLIHTPAYHSLENHNATDQLRRVHEFIAAESADVELLVMDWAEWDDIMYYVQGDYEEFYTDNLADGYLGELGMSFALLVDTDHQRIWAQAFSADEPVMPFESVFPDGIPQDSILFRPDEPDEQVSGLVNTAMGPAIVSSAAIFWSDGTGPAGGHMVAGKLLDSDRMEVISHTLLSSIDLMSVNPTLIPDVFRPALEELTTGDKSYSLLKQDESVYALKMLRDIYGLPLALLRVRNHADISKLGSRTLRITISMLVVAAVILTLTLWLILKGMLLIPLEHLTAVLRGVGDEEANSNVNGHLLSTVKRLKDSKGSISQRKDEIGELMSAFDDLSSSLHEATNRVWRIAHLDGLTGLANRRVVMERLHGFEAENPRKDDIAVLFIDLDNFKNVNDQLGHKAGDQLLVEVASRIRLAVGLDKEAIGGEGNSAHNTIARIGGDEFVVLIALGEDRKIPEKVAEKIVSLVAAPYLIQGAECIIGACVGVALFPEDADNIDGVLAKADSAMYAAKQAGKNTWRRYSPGPST